MMKRELFFILGLFCFTVFPVNAQELSIKSVSLQSNDNTAILSPCLDSNGDTCALIKIKIPGVRDMDFSNKSQFVKSFYKDGVYMVYVPTISRRLDYRHSDFLPGQIDLGDFGYRRLKPGKTYLVQMEAPSNTKDVALLIFKISPIGARLVINGKQVAVSTNGVYEYACREGSYSYSVSRDDYFPNEGILQVDRGENKRVVIDLNPIIHSVNVGCNVSDARVFVDNVNYGKPDVLGLPQGHHRIRIQRDGYLDVEDEINVQANMSPLFYSMKKNKNLKEIHATPVRIFTKSSRVFKNNKVLKDWKENGDIVLMMPGEYEISDNEGYGEIVKVGIDSMDVYLGSEIRNSPTFESIVCHSSTLGKQDVKESINDRTVNDSQLLSEVNAMDAAQINALLKSQMLGLVPVQNAGNTETSEMVRLSRYDADKMYRDALGYFDQKMYNYAVGRFKVASDNGIVGANNALGVCFKNGYGVEKNIHAAKYCFEKGMNNGDLLAQCNLGHLYYENHDYGMAYSLLQDCLAKCLNKTELKNTRLDSQYMLGIMHLNRELPDDVNANSVIGIQYLKDSAREGYKPAQEFLEIYEESQRYMEKMRRQQQSSGTYSPVNNYNTNISNNSNYNGYRNMTPYRSNNYGDYSQPNRMGSRSTYPQRTNSSRNNTNTVNQQRRVPSTTSQIRQTTTTYPKRRVSGSPSPRRSVQSTGMNRNGSYGGRR